MTTRTLCWRVCLSLLLATLLTACGDDSTPEERIRAQIDAMETAAEAGEWNGFMAPVHDSFIGNNGIDRGQLRGFMLTQVNRHTRVRGQLGPVRVTVHEGLGEDLNRRATATFEGLLTGGPGWLPDRGQLYEFSTGWIEEGGEWLLIQASWEPLAGN